VAKSIPPLRLGDECLQYVSSFKYLGHVILNNLTDASDIQREICKMFVRTNKLVRRFSMCSFDVKVMLFRSYCICLYDAALWSVYNAGTISKLLHAIIDVLKLSLVLHVVTVSLRFYLILVCQVLIKILYTVGSRI